MKNNNFFFCPCHEGHKGAWSGKSTHVKLRNFRNCVVVVVVGIHVGGSGVRKITKCFDVPIMERAWF
jgi:hypothetical protein